MLIYLFLASSTTACLNKSDVVSTSVLCLSRAYRDNISCVLLFVYVSIVYLLSLFHLI